ncbi:MAG: cyclase family protein [Betaproteobacteria bacterium]|jgi:kynurenine formamidase
MSNFNKLTVMSAIAFCISVPTAFSGANDPLPGPTYDAPLTENWAPSKYWGAGDKAGSANHMKNPANIKRALATVKQFKAISIGKYYHREAPAFGPRGWNMTIPGTPTGGPFGANALFYHDEMVTTEIGQIQTQFDGPGHIGVNTSKGMYMYNGFNPMSENGYERGAGGRVVGMGDAGVEHVAETGFVCRLVVLDAVAYKKKIGQISAAAEMLPIPKSSADVGGIVTADDIDGILKMQGLDPIGSGDCVALHTGQGNTWSNDRYKSMSSEERAAARAIFAQGEPGFGYSACSYFGERNIALTMGDTSANDAQPGNEVEGWAVPCHTELQVKYGTWNLENVDTKSLVDNKIYEGAFIWSPLRIIGATGSPGNPIVLY